MTEKFANSASSTLNGAISAGASSLTLTSATLFPTSGTFRIIIGTEILAVTAVSGTVLTVTRGAEGTTAATHADGATVTCILTAAALAQLKTDVMALVGDASGTTDAVVNTQARGLKSASTTVSVSAATAPSAGQSLIATSSTAATWQTQTLTGDVSGTVAAAQVDIARGLKSATTTVGVASATAPTSGQVLTATSGTAATWQTPSSGVAGSTTQVMFNDAGALAGDAGLTYVKATDDLVVAGSVALGAAPGMTGELRLSGGTSATMISWKADGSTNSPWLTSDGSGTWTLGEYGGKYAVVSAYTVTVNSYNAVTLKSRAVPLLTLTGDGTDGVATIGASSTVWGVAGSGVVSWTNITPIATTTTGAVTAITYAMPASTVVDFSITVVGIRTGGASGTAGDSYRADFPVTYQRIGSAGPTLVGAAAVETFKKSNGGGSSYAGSVSVSSNNILVQVTGLATTNIDWTVTLQGQQVA